MAIQEQQLSRLNLSLYAGALVATLCGVLTVSDALADEPFKEEMLALTVLGFGFSILCRLLRINTRWVEWVSLSAIVLAICSALAGHLAWGSLMPFTAATNDARVSVVLCWGAVLLSWALMQDSTILFTPLLALATIGLVASFDINVYVIDYFFCLVAATIFLLTQSHSLRLRSLAQPSEMPRQTPRHLLEQVLMALLGGLTVILLALAFVVPVEAVTQNLSLAGAVRQMGLLGAPATGIPLVTRFTDGRSFAIGTGTDWSSSTQVLMRVTPSDGLPHLWRARTYDHYNGLGWFSTLADEAEPLQQLPQQGVGKLSYRIGASTSPTRPLLIADFQVMGMTNQFYYATEPHQITIPAATEDIPIYSVDGRLVLQDYQPLGQIHYQVASQLQPNPMEPPVQAWLQHAGTDYPAGIRAYYLGNMSDLRSPLSPSVLAFFHKAVSEALSGLPPKKRTPINVALALRRWVANRCVYSLAVSPIPLREDHVYAFLDQTRLGYCDLFASSMAVLCRVAGLPARVATGFDSGQQDGTSYQLRVMDMHAWTEVYFPHVGWLDFDPTMGTRTDGTVPSPQSAPAWNWRTAFSHVALLPKLLTALIAALLCFVGLTEGIARFKRRPRAQRRRAKQPNDTNHSYRRLMQMLSRVGLTREPSETPTEFAQRAQHFLEAQGPAGPNPQIPHEVTAYFLAARYSSHPAITEPRDEDGLRLFESAIRRLHRRLIWQRLTAFLLMKEQNWNASKS
jgi:transglutaminase-like putative cysteine protease